MSAADPGRGRGQCQRARQAHALAAGHRGPRRRVPPPRRRDGVDRPRRHAHLRDRDGDLRGRRRARATSASGGCRPGPTTSWRERSPLVGRSAAVRIVKRIPAGAGLGGGSADAAAVLRWAGSTDLDVAARLGADVPFCVRGGRARVTGVGEKVEPLPFEDRRFVLLLSPLSVDTEAVYRRWDDRRARHGAEGHGAGPGGNDLEAAALEVAPAVGALASGVGGGDRPHAATGRQRLDVVRRGGCRGPGHRRARLPRHGGPSAPSLVEVSDGAGDVVALRGRSGPPARATPALGREWDCGLLAGGPPLPAGGLEHLLVLLLAHALAALLDQRSHD